MRNFPPHLSSVSGRVSTLPENTLITTECARYNVRPILSFPAPIYCLNVFRCPWLCLVLNNMPLVPLASATVRSVISSKRWRSITGAQPAERSWRDAAEQSRDHAHQSARRCETWARAQPVSWQASRLSTDANCRVVVVVYLRSNAFGWLETAMPFVWQLCDIIHVACL